MPLMPPDKKIGRFIVPGWLPSWMYTYIEMGADLELMKIELEDLRAEMAVLRKKLAAAEQVIQDEQMVADLARKEQTMNVTRELRWPSTNMYVTVTNQHKGRYYVCPCGKGVWSVRGHAEQHHQQCEQAHSPEGKKQ